MPISRVHRPHTNETCLYGWGFNGTHEHEIFQVDATDGNPDAFVDDLDIEGRKVLGSLGVGVDFPMYHGESSDGALKSISWVPIPTRADPLTRENWNKLSAGDNSCLGIKGSGDSATSSGELWGWGDDAHNGPTFHSSMKYWDMLPSQCDASGSPPESRFFEDDLTDNCYSSDPGTNIDNATEIADLPSSGWTDTCVFKPESYEQYVGIKGGKLYTWGAEPFGKGKDFKKYNTSPKSYYKISRVFAIDNSAPEIGSGPDDNETISSGQPTFTKCFGGSKLCGVIDSEEKLYIFGKKCGEVDADGGWLYHKIGYYPYAVHNNNNAIPESGFVWFDAAIQSMAYIQKDSTGDQQVFYSTEAVADGWISNSFTQVPSVHAGFSLPDDNQWEQVYTLNNHYTYQNDAIRTSVVAINNYGEVWVYNKSGDDEINANLINVSTAHDGGWYQISPSGVSFKKIETFDVGEKTLRFAALTDKGEIYSVNHDTTFPYIAGSELTIFRKVTDQDISFLTGIHGDVSESTSDYKWAIKKKSVDSTDTLTRLPVTNQENSIGTIRENPTLTWTSDDIDTSESNKNKDLIAVGGPGWSTGENPYRVLGIDDTSVVALTSIVDQSLGWKSIKTSGQGFGTIWFPASAGIALNNTLWAWGQHANQGNGVLQVTQTDPESPNNDWDSVTCSPNSLLAIKRNGTLWANGAGAAAFYAHGSNKSVLTQVGSNSNWLEVSASYFHALAITTDGELWVWGQNSQGCLGLDELDLNASYTPTQVISPSKTWVAISAGWKYSVAIASDGTMWVCGDNQIGQLGLGYQTSPFSHTTFEKVPLVNGGDDWVKVSTGGNYPAHTMAIKNDGTLWGVGNSSSYGLGIGNTSWSASFREANGFANSADDIGWVDISCGDNWGFSIGIQTNGKMWGVGRNINGQLGQGFSSPTDIQQWAKISTPDDTGFDKKWQSVSCGPKWSIMIENVEAVIQFRNPQRNLSLSRDMLWDGQDIYNTEDGWEDLVISKGSVNSQRRFWGIR